MSSYAEQYTERVYVDGDYRAKKSEPRWLLATCPVHGVLSYDPEKTTAVCLRSVVTWGGKRECGRPVEHVDVTPRPTEPCGCSLCDHHWLRRFLMDYGVTR